MNLIVCAQAANASTSGDSASSAVSTPALDAVTAATGAHSAAPFNDNVANLAGGASSGTSVGTATDWRNKDADRSARQHIARIMCV